MCTQTEIAFSTLSPRGDLCALTHFESALDIRELDTDERKLVRCPAQAILSITWHPDSKRISLLSRAIADGLEAVHHQFAVYNVRSGACETVFHTECPATGRRLTQCCWSSSGT